MYSSFLKQYYIPMLFIMIFTYSCNPSTSNQTVQQEDKISIACSWVSNDRIIESFLINLKDKTAFWANENKDIEVVFLNDATIKLKGIKPSIKISRPPAENVELEFTINRITGEFNVSWHSSPQQVDWSEKCEKIKMF